MSAGRVFIANRGQIAARIAQSARRSGYEAVAATTADDLPSIAALVADGTALLRGTGPAAYLDAEALCVAAREAQCTHLHPGIGFLSESPALARAAAEADLTFVGPSAAALALLGDKSATRTAAAAAGLPTLHGVSVASAAAAAEAWPEVASAGGAMLKARAGGGGKGIRYVEVPEDLAEAYERASSEAERSFGDGALLLEAALVAPRHVEVQLAADSTGAAVHLGTRDCSLQWRHQKVIEMAPAPGLPDGMAERLYADALAFAEALRERGAPLSTLATVEFLLDASTGKHYLL